MGNSPLTSLRLINGDQSYRVQLGESVAINFRGREVKQQANGEITESWQVSYTVGNSTCKIALTKTSKGNSNTNSPHHLGEKLDIKVTDSKFERSLNRYISLTMQRAEAGLLHPSYTAYEETNRDDFKGHQFFYIHSLSILLKSNFTTHAWGDITETKFDLYGSGRRRGLMVYEWKKKNKDEKPYMGTVAHYYANAENGNDVGLSVAIQRIRVSLDGRLEFSVDGPQQHPVDALFYMFDKVHRTDTWKPTYCPHCANNNIIQRQSESEDSDMDNVPVALPPRGRGGQKGGGAVDNRGTYRGDNIGNVFCNFILGGF